MEKVRHFFLKHLWWLTLLLSALLLAGHTFKSEAITVDTTSLLLVAVIALSPWVAVVKKIKFGDFEAEIDSSEVRRVTSEVEKALPQVQQLAAPEQISVPLANDQKEPTAIALILEL